ncbi:hypothetical protein PIB30_076564 [Stylosanthes scabra]|uniref:Uncharacterized protein n=1 Tax=Stylosanthes scabra TaxID=79078 RepID=A0ABU6QQC6_9FABA|nr:hypothetical protein [Stylosanthes scabra]
MRDHFMSLDREAEMDLVNGMLAAYNHNYFDPRTERPYSIRTLTKNDNNEGPITRHVGSHSLLPKYVTFPKQPNEFDWVVYVIKYMEIVNPNDLAKRSFKIPAWSKEQIEEFREQIVECILCDVDNEFREMVMQVAKPNTRHPRPSLALQSPYIQLDSGDLTSK